MTDMIKIKTSRFGDIEIAGDKVITFPNAIPGFAGLKRFVLLDHDAEGLFKWLQSVDDPDLAFLLSPPNYFKAEFRLPEKAYPITRIDVKSPDEVVVMTMVCVPQDDSSHFTLNFKGPIVFNYSNMMAIQYIVDTDDPEYPCDFRVDIVKSGQDANTGSRSATEER